MKYIIKHFVIKLNPKPEASKRLPLYKKTVKASNVRPSDWTYNIEEARVYGSKVDVTLDTIRKALKDDASSRFSVLNSYDMNNIEIIPVALLPVDTNLVH